MNDTRLLRRASGIVRPLVVGVMVGCIALSVARLARLLADAVGAQSAWNPAYFFLSCLLAALEPYFVRRWTDAMEGAELWRFRATEILAFLVLLKLGAYWGISWAGVQADISTWLREPSRILSAQMILAVLLSLLSWFASTQTLRDLERLDEPLEFSRGFPSPVATLSARFTWGGALLLLVAGITRVGLAALLDMDRPPVPGLVLNVLLYFLLGLVMLGQVRFVALRKEWRGQKAEVADELRGQWVRSSLIFIGLAAVVAFLLPTGYTTYLLDVLGIALGVIVQVLYLVGAVLMFLLSLPFWLIAKLLMGNQAPALSPPALPFSPPRQPELARTPPDWLGVARALFFWAVFLGIAFYLVRGFFREHPDIWRAIVSFAPLRWLLGVWRALRGRFREWEVALRERLPRRQRQQTTGASGGLTTGSRSRWRSNRGRVLYYYLNVVRRANKAGLVRRASQTPDEYGVILERNLPDTCEDVAFLTDAFKEARYSSHTVEPVVVHRARAGWQRVKRALWVLAHPVRPQAGERAVAEDDTLRHSDGDGSG
jgi:hypothetical protein